MNSHSVEDSNCAVEDSNGRQTQEFVSSPFVIQLFRLPLIDQHCAILRTHIEYIFPDDRPTIEGILMTEYVQNPHAIYLNKLIHNFLANAKLLYATPSGSLFIVDIGKTTSMNINIYYDPRDLKRYVIEFKLTYNTNIHFSIDSILQKFKEYIPVYQEQRIQSDSIMQDFEPPLDLESECSSTGELEIEIITQEYIDQLDLEFKKLEQINPMGSLEFATISFDAFRRGAVLPQLLDLDSYTPIIRILEKLNMLTLTTGNVIDCLIKHLTTLTKHNRFVVIYILTILEKIVMSDKNAFIHYLQDKGLMEELNYKLETLFKNINELTSNRHGGTINPIQSNTLYSNHEKIIIYIQNSII